MTAPILVTGGTGTLGRPRRPAAARRRARRPRAQPARRESARRRRVRGRRPAHRRGRRAAVAGVETIVHLAGSTKGDDDKARNLVRPRPAPECGTWSTSRSSAPTGSRSSAGRPGDVRLLRAKLDAEQVVAESGLPWTTLRATQFHDLVADRRAADGEAAGGPGRRRAPVPAGRRRRGRRPAGRAGARRAGRAGARPRRAAGLRDGRAGPRLPAAPPASTGCSCRSDAGQGRPRDTGPAPTWLPTAPSGTGPGRTSWPSGCGPSSRPAGKGGLLRLAEAVPVPHSEDIDSRRRYARGR